MPGENNNNSSSSNDFPLDDNITEVAASPLDDHSEESLLSSSSSVFPIEMCETPPPRNNKCTKRVLDEVIDSNNKPEEPVRRRGAWKPEEDLLLRQAVSELGYKSWIKVAKLVPGRAHWQCSQRWLKVLAPGLIKGPWTQEEDERLIQLVASRNSQEAQAAAGEKGKKVAHQKWKMIAEQMKGRTSKQCRERYTLSLDPKICRDPWTPREDKKLIKYRKEYGNQWAKIRAHVKNRTENQIKSRYKTLMQSFRRNEQVKWTPELIGRVKAIASRHELTLESEMSKVKLPKELRGVSWLAIAERCNIKL